MRGLEANLGNGVRCFQHSQMLQADPSLEGASQFLALWHVGAYFPETPTYIVRIKVEATEAAIYGEEEFKYVGVVDVFHREKLTWQEIHHWYIPTDNPVYSTPNLENFDIIQMALLRSGAFILTMRVGMDE